MRSPRAGIGPANARRNQAAPIRPSHPPIAKDDASTDNDLDEKARRRLA